MRKVWVLALLASTALFGQRPTGGGSNGGGGGSSVCTVSGSQTTGYVLTATNSSTGCDWEATGAASVDANVIKSAWFLTDGGTANAVTGTTATTFPGAYALGQAVIFKANATNTTSTTININSLGNKNLTKGNASGGAVALAAGNKVSGVTYLAVYDGTEFQLVAYTVIAADIPTLNQNTSGTAANLSGTPALPNGTTATTQSQADGTTKIATDAYVDTGLATKGAGTVTNIATGSCLTGGAITTTGTISFSGASNPQTSTYQVLASDFTACKNIPVASGTFTITLVASGSQPTSGQYITIINYGSGVVTVARSGQNINGGTASLTIGAGSATSPSVATIISDGTNYFAAVGSSFPATTCTNQFIRSLAAGTAIGICATVVSADLNITTTTCTAPQNLTAISSGAVGTCTAPVLTQNSQSTAYTTVLGDSGKHIYHPASDNNARTFTIDSNANVAYALGTTITFVNRINTLTISITTDTMFLGGTASTGSRTCAVNCVATAIKTGTTEWVISGPGLT